MSCENHFWEAFSAFSTFLAVVVALFQDKFWNWWHQPTPKLIIFHRRDIAGSADDSNSSVRRVLSKQPASIVTLAVQNTGRPIEDAKVFWVASEWTHRQYKTKERLRVFPERSFEWTGNKANDLPFKAIKLYGDAVFDFFRSEEEPSRHWKPGLVFEGSANEGPFKEFENDPPNTSRDPNFEITVYLQLKGSNYIGEYWPVWMRHDMGTVGGWTMSIEQPITAEQFFKRFHNDTEHFFKATSERLKR